MAFDYRVRLLTISSKHRQIYNSPKKEKTWQVLFQSCSQQGEGRAVRESQRLQEVVELNLLKDCSVPKEKGRQGTILTLALERCWAPTLTIPTSFEQPMKESSQQPPFQSCPRQGQK